MSRVPRRCVRCDAAIPAERVEILPDTQICVKCSEEIGGEFIMVARPENIGKPGSLKKNYGSLRIKKIRKVIPPKKT
ncbi:MAG TPA: hypothetical protein VGZ47_18235 [Gemmataceae bacterium]|jgi:hypothetical protein|nr:hypothetical protein [Gemmataceae bacterium]